MRGGKSRRKERDMKRTNTNTELPLYWLILIPVVVGTLCGLIVPRLMAWLGLFGF